MSYNSAPETMVDEDTLNDFLKCFSESDSELDSDSEVVQDALDWLDLQDDSGDGISKGVLSFGGMDQCVGLMPMEASMLALLLTLYNFSATAARSSLITHPFWFSCGMRR